MLTPRRTWRKIRVPVSHQQRTIFYARRYHSRSRTGGERGGLAGGRARLLGGAVGDAAGQGDAGPSHGALRGAGLLELPGQSFVDHSVGSLEGGVAEAGVGDP